MVVASNNSNNSTNNDSNNSSSLGPTNLGPVVLFRSSWTLNSAGARLFKTTSTYDVEITVLRTFLITPVDVHMYYIYIYGTHVYILAWVRPHVEQTSLGLPPSTAVTCHCNV